jgi:hypothetical protein
VATALLKAEAAEVASDQSGGVEADDDQSGSVEEDEDQSGSVEEDEDQSGSAVEFDQSGMLQMDEPGNEPITPPTANTPDGRSTPPSSVDRNG